MNSLRRIGFFSVAIAMSMALLALGACQRKAQETAPAAETAAAKPATAWTAFRDEYIEAFFKAHPVAAVGAGRHDFDGRLPDWSKEGIANEIGRLKAARDKAAAFDSKTLADESERFERDYLLTRIDRDLFWLDTAEAPFRNPAFYLDWILDGLDPSVYLTRNYAPLDRRMRAYVKYAQAIPQATEQITTNLRMPLSLTLLERGVSAFNGFADFYRDDVPKVFGVVADAALQADFQKANGGAERAMRKLAGWLEANRGSANQRYALGADKFAKMLEASERVTTPLDELEKVGHADLERNLEALRGACGKFLPGKPLPDCIARMSQNKPQGGSVQGARGQLAGLKSFILERGIVSVPGTEEALVNEAPPYARANSAYIDIPGPYEKGLPAVYYISPPDPSWTQQEQRDYIPGRTDLLFTSVHEVWPGHFLQFLHSNRNDSIVGRLFVGYAFAEGWAHYSEEMMREVGLSLDAKNPELDAETHIGQLSNALLRNVRYLCAIGLHARGMSVAECEKMFREKAFTDAGTARQQAARGTYDPAYLNYTMGKLMIRKLRDDWTAPRGGRAAWRDFHDKFLSYGGPPVPMVRAAMLGNADGALF